METVDGAPHNRSYSYVVLTDSYIKLSIHGSIHVRSEMKLTLIFLIVNANAMITKHRMLQIATGVSPMNQNDIVSITTICICALQKRVSLQYYPYMKRICSMMTPSYYVKVSGTWKNFGQFVKYRNGI